MGTVDLGLTRADWGKLTPRVVLLMWKRKELLERRQDRRAGLVAALLYNAHRDPKKDRAGKEWTDFFPDLLEDTDAKVRTQAERFRAWLADRPQRTH